jgi:hypothetical protein
MGEQNEPGMRLDGIVEHGGRIVPVEEHGRIENDRGRREKRDCPFVTTICATQFINKRTFFLTWGSRMISCGHEKR